MDTKAKEYLSLAVRLDRWRVYPQSLRYYNKGIGVLIKCLQDLDGEEKMALRKKIEGYMERAEYIKSHNEAQNKHEQIIIVNNSVGHDYEKLIGHVFDSRIQNITIEDPYIRVHHQCVNFLRFCELIVKKCKHLKTILLVTIKIAQTQEDWLMEIKKYLSIKQINLTFEYRPTLHDRQIILSNGWIIKSGRGLDIYKTSASYLGLYELDLRACYETTIDIFHRKNVKFH